MSLDETKCDWCAQNITKPDNCNDYRILLKAEKKETQENLPLIPDSLPDDKNFCGFVCLKSWVNQ